MQSSSSSGAVEAQGSPPFGAFAPTRMQSFARRIGATVPSTFWGRRFASLLLWPSGGRSGRPFDVAVFGSQKARLHPYDNICEKRVFISPQLWDQRERALLQAFIAGGSGAFTFVDVGANAGLYALFAASAARAANRAIRIVAIEPAAVMRARMAFNFAASSVNAAILPYAATGAPGAVRLATNLKNRGMSRVTTAGDELVQGKPLFAIIEECGLAAVDIMKIDIEGGEFAALSAYFRDAPEHHHPQLLVMETSQDDPGRSAKALVTDNDYSISLETPLNTVFERR
ncbi:MAG: FkbM family methyltransferase [Parvularculaceae bacterium]